jgi:hypothetical protein
MQDNTMIQRQSIHKSLNIWPSSDTYLGMTVVDKKYTYKRSWRLLLPFLSSRLVFNNVNIEIYMKLILSIMFHGCEIWSLSL